MRSPDPVNREEILHATFISLLAEGIAVALFIAAAFVWLVILKTPVPV